MIMDNFTLGTLASWLSDCKVENVTKLDNIQPADSTSDVPMQNSKLKLWTPWDFENKTDPSKSKSSHKIHRKDYQVRLKCFQPEYSSEILSLGNFSGVRFYPNALPYPKIGKPSFFANNWNCQEGYKNYFYFENNCNHPSRNKADNVSNISEKHALQLSQTFEGEVQNHKYLGPKVSEVSKEQNFMQAHFKKKVGIARQTQRPATDNWFQFNGISVEPKLRAENNSSVGSTSLKSGPPTSCSQSCSNEYRNDKHFERLVLNQIEEFPSCKCGAPRSYDESLDGPFYTHLGVAESVEAARKMITKRLDIKDDELRLEKVVYTGKEGKNDQGCPIAKWIIRRSSLKEKVLVLVRQIQHHHCINSVMVIGICLWEGLPEDHATELYDYLRLTLPKYGEATERRCATNEKKTCACQGWNESSGGASFSFGCSWSMYYNGCKFARSVSPRKFHLRNNAEEELILEHHLQTLATVVAPIYERVAPASFKNQTMFESVASDCRLGYKPGRPWSGVTAVVDFCTHAHKDFNNMNNGCTTVLTLTKHRGLEKPEDEQLHVLPLCVLESGDEYEDNEEIVKKVMSGALECLASFPSTMRVRTSPFICKRKQRQVRASMKKDSWNNCCHLEEHIEGVSSSPKIHENIKYTFKKELPSDISSNSRDLYLSSTPKTPTVLPAFSQFISSLTNFGKSQSIKQLHSSHRSNLSSKMDQDHGLYLDSARAMTTGDVNCEVNYFSDTISSSKSFQEAFYLESGYEKQASKHNFKNFTEQSPCLDNVNCAPSATFHCSTSSLPRSHQFIDASFSQSLGSFQNNNDNCNKPSISPSHNFKCNLDKGDENCNPETIRNLEIFTSNRKAFRDKEVGGVAIALTHGSLLFEVAKRELHATTALKCPDRSKPTRMSLVFYQHKSLNKAQHGRAEYEKKLKERREKKVEEMTLASQKCLKGEPGSLLCKVNESVDKLFFPQAQHNFGHHNQNEVSNDKTLFPFSFTRSSEHTSLINQVSFPRVSHMPFEELNHGLQNKGSLASGTANQFCESDNYANLYLSSCIKGKKD